MCYSTLHCFDESERKIASFHYTLSLTFSFFPIFVRAGSISLRKIIMDRTHRCGDILHGLHGWQRNISLSRLICYGPPYLAFWKRALLSRLFLLAFWAESRMIKHTNTLVAGVLIRDRLDSCALKRGQIGLRLALATHVVAVDCSSKAMSCLDCQYTRSCIHPPFLLLTLHPLSALRYLSR